MAYATYSITAGIVMSKRLILYECRHQNTSISFAKRASYQLFLLKIFVHVRIERWHMSRGGVRLDIKFLLTHHLLLLELHC